MNGLDKIDPWFQQMVALIYSAELRASLSKAEQPVHSAFLRIGFLFGLSVFLISPQNFRVERESRKILLRSLTIGRGRPLLHPFHRLNPSTFHLPPKMSEEESLFQL